MTNPQFFALPLLLISVLAACGGSAEKSLSSARDYLAKQDHKAAIIEIKNALQQKPDSTDARVLLGVALLEAGDAVNAELELRKALDLKAPPDLVVPKLAGALVAARQFKKLTDEFGAVKLADLKANAELQANLANAFAMQGKADLFDTHLRAALAAEPGYEPALVAQARQKAGAKEFDQALAMADAIIAKNTRSAEGWRLKGDIQNHAKRNPDEAGKSYRKAIEAKPDLVAAHTSLVTLLLEQGKLEDASTQLEVFRKSAPNNILARYLQAQLSYQKKEFKAAREQSQVLLRVASSNPRVLQLAGAVEYQLGSFLQAEVLLNRAVTAAPESVLARRLLISTYLRSGQPAKALASLQQGLAKGVMDPEIDSIAGEVYLQNGDVKKAEESFAKAAKAAPNDPRKQTSLALTRLSGPGSEAAMGELQEIASGDKGVTADMALISAHLRRGDFERAMKAIDGLEKKQADKPFAANLRGRTQLAMKNPTAARKSFERALEVDPLFFQAVASLAALDLADKKPGDAKKRFESVLSKEPKHPQALLALAELAARTNAPKEEIAGLLAKAVEANPTEPAPRLQLINFHLGHKEFKQALSLAQNAVAALPDNPDVLDALGRVQQASGDTNQALTTFSKVVSLQPLSPRPLLRLAEAHLAGKNTDAAIQSLKKAIEIKPDLLEAQRGLIGLSMEAKKPAEALSIAKSIQKQRPKEVVGYALEGDVQAAQKNWDAALSAYKAGLKELPSPELAIKTHSVLMVAGKPGDADKFSAGWVKDHGRDHVFQFYLGDAAIARKDYEGAEKAYQAVIKLQPTHATAYNNLAWVSGKLNRPSALSLADKALELSPNQPSFMDTLATLYSDAKKHDRALELQTKVMQLAPGNLLFKLNLARIQIGAGKRDEARKNLEELAKLGDKFPAQSEVASLLKSL